jgi:hypothetical protein
MAGQTVRFDHAASFMHSALHESTIILYLLTELDGWEHNIIRLWCCNYRLSRIIPTALSLRWPWHHTPFWMCVLKVLDVNLLNLEVPRVQCSAHHDHQETSVMASKSHDGDSSQIMIPIHSITTIRHLDQEPPTMGCKLSEFRHPLMLNQSSPSKCNLGLSPMTKNGIL